MRVACIFFSSKISIQDFAEACFSLSPQICIRRDEAVFIEIGRCRSLFTEEQFELRIASLIKEFGALARLSIRNSVIESLIAAKFGTDDFSEIPISALLYFSDPYGFSSVDESVVKIEEILRRVAISNIKEFSDLSDSQISSRFGKIGTYWKRQVKDPTNIPWPKWKPRENISEKLALSHEDACGSIEPLLFALKEVLDRIFDRIKKRGLRLVKIKIDLKLEQFSTVKRKNREWIFEFAFPQESTKAVLPILRERWDKEFQRDPLESLVLEVNLDVLEMIEGFEGQNNFIDKTQEISASHNAMLSQLVEKNGKHNVYKASLKNRRLPEYSWEKATECQTPDLELLKRLPKRPTEGFLNPLPIRITADKIFLRNNRSFKIVTWSEVEKIRDQWLDGTKERDYYKVVVEGEPPLWIFKTPEGEYFLHGWFR